MNKLTRWREPHRSRHNSSRLHLLSGKYFRYGMWTLGVATLACLPMLLFLPDSAVWLGYGVFLGLAGFVLSVAQRREEKRRDFR
jgi:hypothetical protein